jgi:Ca2+-binding EF-hand superfamily protein
MTTKIDKTDVQSVANQIGKELTNDQINVILSQYDNECLNSPDDNWTEIVENLIYSNEF